MKITLFLLTIFFTFEANALDVYNYSSSTASGIPKYTIKKYKPYSLKGKQVIFTGRLFKASGNTMSNFFGHSSIVVRLRNLKRQGYKYNIARIYVSGDVISILKKRIGKSIMIKGKVTSGELSKTRYEGERILALGFEVSKLWK